MKLAKKIIHKYAPALDGSSRRATATSSTGSPSGGRSSTGSGTPGKNPTRKSLMHALRTLNEKNNPFIYPGMSVKTSKKRNFPMQQLVFIKWSGGGTGDCHATGKVLNSGH